MEADSPRMTQRPPLPPRKVAQGAPKNPPPRVERAAESPREEKRDEKPPVPVVKGEVRDFWAALFGLLEEYVGPSFKISDDKLDALGERWTRLLNRYVPRAADAMGIASSALAVILTIGILISCVRKHAEWKRDEAKRAAAETTVPGRVVSMVPNPPAAGSNAT